MVLRACSGVQHVHRESGDRRPDRRPRRDADEYDLHLHGRLAVWGRSVSAVDRRRLYGQHGLHTQPLRAQPRPLLVSHVAARVPQQADHQESTRHDIAGTEYLSFWDDAI